VETETSFEERIKEDEAMLVEANGSQVDGVKNNDTLVGLVKD
jgi:hypothetical protein